MKTSLTLPALAGVAILVAFIGINVTLLSATNGIPKIQGVVIPDARALSEFQLVNHHNQPFSNHDLRDRWYLISYGYTDCPDICPMTLSKLAKVEKKLATLGKFQDVQMLFYTIDPQRDTVDRLSQYVEFFGQSFLGLTWGTELQTDHVPFERSLGIASAITPLPEEEAISDPKGYTVSHGVVLYLLNPEGKLQAILKPDTNDHGFHSFAAEKIYRDYIAIRNYFG